MGVIGNKARPGGLQGRFLLCIFSLNTSYNDIRVDRFSIQNYCWSWLRLYTHKLILVMSRLYFHSKLINDGLG